MHNKNRFVRHHEKSEAMENAVAGLKDVIGQLGSENFGKAVIAIPNENGEVEVYDATSDVHSIPVIPASNDNNICRYDECSNNCSCTESHANNIPVPAVTFDINVYTHNDKCTIPGNIYNTLTDINLKLIDESMNRVNDDTAYYEARQIRYCASSIIDTIINNFDAALNNCMLYHLTIMNEYFVIEEGAPSIINFLDYDTHDGSMFNSIFRPRLFEIKSMVNEIEFANSVASQYNMFQSGYAIDRAIAYTNDFGMNIYSYIRRKLNNLFVNIDVKDSSIVMDIFEKIKHEFSIMMQDFTYEAGVFIYNLEQFYSSNHATPEYVKQLDDATDEYYKRINGNSGYPENEPF